MGKISRDRERQMICNARKDPEQFDELYNTYVNSIFNFVLRRVNDTNVAEDITADTFYKALKSIKRFKFKSSFSTYLFRIAENEIYRFYRSKKLLSLPVNKEFYDIEDPPNVEAEELLQAIEKTTFQGEGNNKNALYRRKKSKGNIFYTEHNQKHLLQFIEKGAERIEKDSRE